ncbi:MAG: hypothetical protein ACTSUE_16975 [Promethearchaeota archaeon]
MEDKLKKTLVDDIEGTAGSMLIFQAMSFYFEFFSVGGFVSGFMDAFDVLDVIIATALFATIFMLMGFRKLYVWRKNCVKKVKIDWRLTAVYILITVEAVILLLAIFAAIFISSNATYWILYLGFQDFIILPLKGIGIVLLYFTFKDLGSKTLQPSELVPTWIREHKKPFMIIQVITIILVLVLANTAFITASLLERFFYSGFFILLPVYVLSFINLLKDIIEMVKYSKYIQYIAR